MLTRCFENLPIPTLDDFHQGQKGSSLVEMLVVIAISTMVIGIITTSLVQFLLVTNWGNDQLLVTSDLQVAALWLGRDVPEASTFTQDTVDHNQYGFFAWRDHTGVWHEYHYYYNPTKGSLVREYRRDDSTQTTLNVARNIAEADDVNFSPSGDLVTVEIKSTSGDVSKTIELNLAMRTD
ncbi:MAG: prepilin-type N-terminal cleavage/methylation domain-containing protein [Anaerolineales bacterium]|nr:prepilin-type N-terminal cleavage/methylation domain-containing protein [Anaerolineales bacterium]